MSEEKIMQKIAKMLELANHANTSQTERETFLAKADALMQKYALDMATVEASLSREDRRQPIQKTVEFMIGGGYAYQANLRTVLHYLAEANRCKMVAYTDGTVELFGLQEDVLYVEMVWANVNFDFLSKVDPKWEPAKGLDENVYNFVKAGYKWREIATYADCPWPDGGRMIRAYKRHQKVLGEEHQSHTQSHGLYKEAFVDSYCNAVCRRLVNLINEREEQSDGTGAGLVLHDLADMVSALFFAAYPDRSPEAQQARLAERDRILREAAEREAERWASLTETQRFKETEAKERQRIRDAKANDKYWQEQYRKEEMAAPGARAGRSAGNAVKLTKEREAHAAEDHKEIN